MRAFVFTDKALARYAGQFVWLSVDTENSTNAAFLKKYPINVWPTMLVIDPKSEKVALRYSGGATVPQLEKLLNDGKRAAGGAKASADEAIARADRLSNEEKNAEAAAEYEKALKEAPKGWSRYGRAAESLVLALTLANEPERCATRATELYPKLRGTSSGAIVVAEGMDCAADVPETNASRKSLVETLERDTKEAFDDRTIDMSGDDRSALYMALIKARDVQGDKPGATKLREEWAAFLEHEAANAKTAEQRAVYDSHRLSAYMELGTPEKAIPMLEQSEKDFPKDYNPPARLAAAYRAMKKWDEALVSIDLAAKLAYGPRKIGILRSRADILAAKGDKDAARAAMRDAIAYAESLPGGQRNDRAIAALKKKLDTM